MYLRIFKDLKVQFVVSLFILIIIIFIIYLFSW